MGSIGGELPSVLGPVSNSKESIIVNPLSDVKTLGCVRVQIDKLVRGRDHEIHWGDVVRGPFGGRICFG